MQNQPLLDSNYFPGQHRTAELIDLIRKEVPRPAPSSFFYAHWDMGYPQGSFRRYGGTCPLGMREGAYGPTPRNADEAGLDPTWDAATMSFTQWWDRQTDIDWAVNYVWGPPRTLIGKMAEAVGRMYRRKRSARLQKRA